MEWKLSANITLLVSSLKFCATTLALLLWAPTELITSNSLAVGAGEFILNKQSFPTFIFLNIKNYYFFNFQFFFFFFF